ncbi:DUF4123 domain-containing protein [Hahella sp. HN01]|uniref:DUF4123 domain-containing protein n=1 Tax=Hahella sp. HN01 TaxID=2847262 RepID=UPI001C1F0E5F|nr:DUF4123 domain-containing protein [Hahella sp. HN01]MBU6950179.1 DUF4123 domain-containing protein [Hahella sp. HN01]
MDMAATIETLKAQCPNFEYYYAIVDCAQDDSLYEKIQLSGCQYSALLEAEASEELLRVSPHIIELRENAFCSWLLAHGWGRSWAIYIASQRPIGYLIRHFKKLSKVTGPQRQSWFFRYYDPRVCRDLLPICDASQLNRIIGKAGVFWMEGLDSTTTLKYSWKPGQLECSTYLVNGDNQAIKQIIHHPEKGQADDDSDSYVSVSQSQYDTLKEGAHRNFILSLIKEVSTRHPDKAKVYSQEQLIRYIEFALTQMNELGGHGAHSANYFIEACFSFGWDFLSNPDYYWVREKFLDNPSIEDPNRRLKSLFEYCRSQQSK